MLTRTRWFALVRQWHPWLVPRHGKSDFKLDKDAVLCSFLSPEGKHLVILGVSLGNVVTVLKSDDSGQVVLHVGFSHKAQGMSTITDES